MVQGLMAKVGLSQEQAEKVVSFLRDNASKLPQWLQKSGDGGFAEEASKHIPGI